MSVPLYQNNITPIYAHTRKSSLEDKVWLAIGFLLILAPWVPYQSTRSALLTRQTEIEGLQAGHRRLIKGFKAVTKKVQKYTEQATEMEGMNMILLDDLRVHHDNMDTETNYYRESQKLEDKMLEHVDILQNAIQVQSREAAIKRYGKGPYRVEVTLQVDDKTEPFTIETAPLSEMPHAVNHFMRMVENELWDGLSVVGRSLDKEPILQFIPMESKSEEWVDDTFEEIGLAEMSFTEYSFDYTPEKYSVAFAGRPGGPDFYINMDDLSDPTEEGESCFGLVVEGRHVLDRVLKLQSQSRNEEDQPKVEVKSIRFLSK